MTSLALPKDFEELPPIEAPAPAAQRWRMILPFDLLLVGLTGAMAVTQHEWLVFGMPLVLWVTIGLMLSAFLGAKNLPLHTLPRNPRGHVYYAICKEVLLGALLLACAMPWLAGARSISGILYAVRLNQLRK